MEQQVSPHSLSSEALFELHHSSESGLDQQTVEALQARFGKNTLPLAPPVPAWKRFVLQFHNVLIYVLILSGTISGLLGHFLDCGVILAVIIVNAIVGFIQEGKAENALRAILSMTTSQCMVIRNGVLKSVESSELVTGDIAMLQAGDRVPADIRLFYCKDFRCDESALTGESHPVSKNTTVLPESIPLAERKNMAFMGAMVTYGLARGIVTGTGLSTQIGQISEMVGKAVLTETPLQRQLKQFAHQLTIAIVVISLITLCIGIFLHHYAAGEMFQAAIGIAVAAIPEGLPAIVTIALAIGVQRMADNKALVRRLPAVEVLGSVDVICSDKTGTLTANEMTARAAYTANGEYRITGEGYQPEGAFALVDTKQRILMGQDPVLTQACEIAALCNDARIEHQRAGWTLHGDPTEGALLVLAMKHGVVAEDLSQDWPRIEILPFESEKCYMATLHHHLDGHIRLYVKGAPERLLDYGTKQLTETGTEPINQAQWQQKVDVFAKRGMRVMALAMKVYEKKPDVLSYQSVESDLVMVGLVGMSDPPRPEAIKSIQSCDTAGIHVKMITGDNPVTASAIGTELGLNTERVLTGQEIDRLSASELAKEVERTDVFARTSPANKLQLVHALQQNHHVVAMTGDGVNDAPALKQANIGVAMGKKGTDAAKEAADFVLTDDNFSTIAKAVSEGRTVYDNILKSIIFILPTSLAEALVIMIAIALGGLMPITPAQILWINMITTITLALALAFERPEPNIMARPPRPYDQGLFSMAVVVRMLLVGILGASIIFALFHSYRMAGASIDYARTIAINALVMIEMFYLWNCKLLSQSIFSTAFVRGSRPIWIASACVMVLELIFCYWPASQALFGLEPITLNDWFVIITMTAPVLFAVELGKYMQRVFSRKKNG